jgi:hypothetical protein
VKVIAIMAGWVVQLSLAIIGNRGWLFPLVPAMHEQLAGSR